MGFVPADLTAIPVQRLAPRRLHLGPFGSARDLVKFLCFATVGATVAAVTSAVVWLPFLAVGAMVAFVRVEGQSLDQFALGYGRFRWRSSTGFPGAAGPSPPASRISASSRVPPPAIRAGGIPIAYLPPSELQRLFEEWRSALATLDHPIGCRVRGELFSPLPFLPVAATPREAERTALESYRELVRLLLRRRYRRVVDLTVWNTPSDTASGRIGREAQVDELVAALDRLGIPAQRVPTDAGGPAATVGAPA
ncbi:MAG: hypothetical protein WA688_09415 [Thermoplasmata archaeon]